MNAFIFLILSSLGFALSASAATVDLSTVVKDSKVLFTNKTDTFNLVRKDGSQNTTFSACRERAFSLRGPFNMINGWDSKAVNMQDFDEATKDMGTAYYYMECRTQDQIATIWLQDQTTTFPNTGVYGDIAYNFLQDKFKLADHELVIQIRSLVDAKAEYFSCKNAITKEKMKETEYYIAYNINTSCDSLASYSKTGLPDFLSNPGPYAAQLSYWNGPLPAIEPSAANFKMVVQELLKHIPEGTYSGAMKTLSKTCDTEISFKNDTLYINHSITTTTKPRVRRLEFKAADLLGFVQGDLYEDPIRIDNKVTGTFSSAEFVNKDKTINIRFEQNTDKEGQILRINGSEAYCRRLVKK